MRKRGYPGGFAAGLIAAGGTLGILLPPSITMILYAVAAEQSLGRLFLAGIGPALLLVTFFAAYAAWRYTREAQPRPGQARPCSPNERYTLGQKFAALPRVLPFVLLLTGVMVALYGGFATPSETAGLGAILALILIARDLQHLAAQAARADHGQHDPRIDHADADHRHVAALLAT